MKLILTTIMAISANVYSAGTPFYTNINGVQFYCAPTGNQTTPPNNGGDILDCIEKAYSGIFSRVESEEICQGATSTAPADCALSAYAGIFSRRESIDLCKGAYTTGPADCAKKAYDGPFTKTQSLELCSNRSATLDTANCAIRAYAGPYTREEAIRICKPTFFQNLDSLARNLTLKNDRTQATTLSKSDEQNILQLIKQNERSAKELQRNLDSAVIK